ncbi:unnamed protein product [Didymodactylos carnosus]|uniref:Uncharacterized protein n=1 Tax=Didymodactylos carnosus TaxID=1234261 RepID=A0A815EWU1_9BILA|nr:unnamed protein product [Didymodactylos carnosus]CAF1317232.1 unnamed protein product [Didymodactylos carnosus]CAF3832177.1 unnamed protein product [Didymodactylos carnosus]CAF4160068.1 unnamed protein product [Didymodactylos carnosus]
MTPLERQTVREQEHMNELQRNSAPPAHVRSVERQTIWEQEHLNELQGNPALRPHGLQIDDTERYAEFLQDQLWQDQQDQVMAVNDMGNYDFVQECRRNEELLMQKEEWKDTAFRLQQFQ